MNGAGPKVSQQIIDSFVKNLGGTPVHNIQNYLLRQRKRSYRKHHQLQCSDFYPDNDSLGRNLTDADVANDQWLKERGGLKSFLRACDLR
jgi:hypothetical protein